ncbi:hypothetical protein [Streptomyces sp. NPDC088146]|uniref:hypothetical protein n=1 Tax=Streptomyces sp. NPDC088146 TaxID=3365829 RepID=UPI00380D7D8B
MMRRFRRRGAAPAPAEAAGGSAAGAARGASPRTVRDEFPHRYLLRSSAVPDSPVRELVRELPADPRRPVVVVDVPQKAAGNLGEELGSLLARLREEEPLAVRLVLSGAAAPAGEAGPLAQRLADAWEVTLEAPDAPAVLTPGGLLYVTEPATPGGGWWRFAPGTAPEALGARLPAPRWQHALTRVPLGPIGESVVRAVPAGLALYPAGTAAPRPDELAYAVAVHPERLSVLLGAPRAEPVAAEDLATLLAGLPAEPRHSLRLVPADGREAVGLAEEVCDLLGTEIEVSLGLPVTATGSEDNGEAEGESVRLVSPEGEFTWPAPLTALVCSPTGEDGSRPAPRPAAWAFPEKAGVPGTEPASLRLPSGAWAVAVRSGLWLGTSPEPPAEVRDRAGESRALRVEIAADCLSGKAAGEKRLKDLAALLTGLGAAARTHSELAVSEDVEPDAVAGLRRFAIRTGLTLAAAPRRSSAPALSGSAPTSREVGTSADEATATRTETATPRPSTPVAVAAPTAGGDSAAEPGPPVEPEPETAPPAPRPRAEKAPAARTGAGTPRTEGHPSGTGAAAADPAPRPRPQTTPHTESGPAEPHAQGRPPTGGTVTPLSSARPEETPGPGAGRGLPHTGGRPAVAGAGGALGTRLDPAGAVPDGGPHAPAGSGRPAPARREEPTLPPGAVVGARTTGAGGEEAEPSGPPPSTTSGRTTAGRKPAASATPQPTVPGATAPPPMPAPAGQVVPAPAPSVPAQVRTPVAPAQVRPPAAPARRRRAPVGFSGEPDRRAFRELAAEVWEKHSGPVGQALIRLPALRGTGEDAARADLIAVHLYLSSSPEDPFGARALAEDSEALRPYAACLASGLQRLPALRGTLVRAVAQPAVPDEVVPGAVLECDAPLDVVHLEAQDAPLPPLSHVRYVIRPVTARRTSVLSVDGNGVHALFGTGTAFTVLTRHEAEGDMPARVLLAELPTGTGRFREPSPEAVERLDSAARRPGAAGALAWPDRCTGPFHHAPPVR